MSGHSPPSERCPSMNHNSRRMIAWVAAATVTIGLAAASPAQADNLNLCASGRGCLFRDANFWNLQASASGGTGPHNVPWAINDSASSYANKSASTMTVYTNTNSGGTCTARGAGTQGNFYAPFQDSISSWSMRAGGC